MPQVVPGAADPTATRDDLDLVVSSMPATRGDVANVLLTGGTTGSFTDLIGREANRRGYQAGQWLGVAPRDRTLTPEEATERFGIEGQLTFDRPISEREAAWRQEAKRDELFRLDILQRNESVGTLEGLGYGLLGGFLDPASAGLNLIPGIGQEAFLARLGMAAATTTRGGAIVRGLMVGGTEGTVIGAGQEGLTYYLAHGREGRDYSLQDLMLGVTASGLFGAGTRGVLDGLGWTPPRGAGEASQRPRVTRDANLGAGNTVADLIRQLAGEAGEDADTAVAIAMIESRLNPNAKNPDSSAAGLFQFIDDTWNDMGGGDKFDVRLNAERGIRLMRSNRERLRRGLGREPEPWELYLAHQQGAGGARQLLQDPNRPAVEALRAAGVKDPAAAVRLNGGGTDMTAGQFAAIWRRKFGETAPALDGGGPILAAAPDVRIDPVPPAIDMMSRDARLGAVAHALDRMAKDEAVAVGPLIESELAQGGRARPSLDENPASAIVAKHRVLEGVGEDRAVTVRGTEVPVRYAIVEAEDLITSHDDDLIRNPQFPDELQPRDRERAGSQARLLRMEKEFNPRRLMTSPDAESGAPIVSKDLVVESGNGRSIMVRRNLRRDTKVAKAYRGELTRRGYDVTGFEMPVLVRIRDEAMDGRTRVKLASEMNGDVTERLSATEQAFADARILDDTDLGLFRGGEITSVANDAFARRFVDKAGAGQENDLVDGSTQRLSLAGVERVQAAMVARAFGDRQLVYSLFETQDNNIKAIGKGLMGAAPDWARMRAASARGELAPGADTTEALTAAVALVKHARDNRLKLGELVEDWADQDRLLGGSTLSPATRAYLRVFFRDDGLKSPSSADHIAEALRATAEKALDTQPGPDIFGDVHAFDAATILERASARIREEAATADAGLFGAGSGPAAGPDRGGLRGGEPEASRGPGSEGRSGSGEGDAGGSPRDRPDGPALNTEALTGEAARIQRMRDALVSGRMLNGLEVDAETRSYFEGVIASYDRNNPKAADAEAPRDRPDGDDLEQAGGRDPELQALEDEVAAMEAELQGHVAAGLFDDDTLASIDDGLIDADTMRSAIDAAVACLAEGGE